MQQVFDDIVFKVRGREYAYRAHTLETNQATHSGFATAALVAVWMLGTDEAAQRGLASLDTPEERARLMDRYEAETFREDGGLLMLEIEALYWWLWHIDNHNDNENENDGVAPSNTYEDDDTILELGIRQQGLWSKLINEYMTRLVDRWAAAVLAAEDTVADCESYLDYLLGQLAAYSRIQRMREVRWCDRYSVEEFWTLSDCEPGWITEHIDLKDIITHLPADVDEQALMESYFTLRQAEHAQRKAKPTAAEWYAVEQKPLDPETLSYLSPDQQAELTDQQKRWLRQLSKKLKLVTDPTAPVIWTEFVTKELEQKLIAHLQNHEEEVNWCQQITAAVMAMRVCNLVRRNLTVAEFRKWAPYYLHKDYSSPSVRTQLARKWNSWGRMDTEVQNHIRYISNYE